MLKKFTSLLMIFVLFLSSIGITKADDYSDAVDAAFDAQIALDAAQDTYNNFVPDGLVVQAAQDAVAAACNDVDSAGAAVDAAQMALDDANAAAALVDPCDATAVAAAQAAIDCAQAALTSAQNVLSAAQAALSAAQAALDIASNGDYGPVAAALSVLQAAQDYVASFLTDTATYNAIVNIVEYENSTQIYFSDQSYESGVLWDAQILRARISAYLLIHPEDTNAANMQAAYDNSVASKNNYNTFISNAEGNLSGAAYAITQAGDNYAVNNSIAMNKVTVAGNYLSDATQNLLNATDAAYGAKALVSAWGDYLFGLGW